MSQKVSYTVSFRLDPAMLKKLDDQAKIYDVSVHERARQIVLDRLEARGEERTIEKLIETLDEVRTLRGDLAEAVEWMVQNLKTK